MPTFNFFRLPIFLDLKVSADAYQSLKQQLVEEGEDRGLVGTLKRAAGYQSKEQLTSIKHY